MAAAFRLLVGSPEMRLIPVKMAFELSPMK
jgi:hypothetical protein